MFRLRPPPPGNIRIPGWSPVLYARPSLTRYVKIKFGNIKHCLAPSACMSVIMIKLIGVAVAQSVWQLTVHSMVESR
jgi:hypothetical protein